MFAFRNDIRIYDEELSAPRPTPKLEDHPSSAVRDCLFNLFAATVLIGGRSSIRNLRTRHAVVTGTHYMVLWCKVINFIRYPEIEIFLDIFLNTRIIVKLPLYKLPNNWMYFRYTSPPYAVEHKDDLFLESLLYRRNNITHHKLSICECAHTHSATIGNFLSAAAFCCSCQRALSCFAVPFTLAVFLNRK